MPVAFSSVPSILSEIKERRYMENAPAHTLGNLIRDFSISKSNLNLAKGPTITALEKKKTDGIALANWQDNQLQAVEGGRAPDYVQLILDNPRETEQPTLDGRYLGNVTFRADFVKGNALKVGQHSVLFGFTSDLPPRDEPIRIEGFMAKGFGEKGKPAAFDPAVVGAGTGVGNAVATGIAPTPVGAPTAGLATGTPAVSGLGGGVGIGGGTGGGGGLVGAGFGGARSPSVGGGGGIGGGRGNGNGNGDGTQDGNQDENQNQGININVTQNNKQSQKQQQQQKQNQKNGGGGHCGCDGPPDMVIPAPPALLLGLLGLPALFVIRRKYPS